MILGITGATGFIGGHLLDLAIAAGHGVRALTRSPQPPRAGVTWITGTLADPSTLFERAEAAIHIAGAVNAADRAEFAADNIDGTRAILAAAKAAGIRRFIHVSSLSAREPSLSDYGWSKREAERVIEASDREWTILRPTGVYGPGDVEMRDMFRLARVGVALHPPRGRVSLIAVEDLARLLLTLAERGGPRAIWEVDDGTGLTHAELARAIGRAVGRRVLPIPLPPTALALAARIDRRLRGAGAKLTPDRVRYLVHPDWTADPARRPPADLWRPQIPLATGLAATAEWYRAHRLL